MSLPKEGSNKALILQAMDTTTWYSPKALEGPSGVGRADAYLRRLARDGLVRKRSASSTHDKMFEYRKVKQ